MMIADKLLSIPSQFDNCKEITINPQHIRSYRMLVHYSHI